MEFRLRILKCSYSIENLQEANVEDYTKMALIEEIRSQLPTLIYLSHISAGKRITF